MSKITKCVTHRQASVAAAEANKTPLPPLKENDPILVSSLSALMQRDLDPPRIDWECSQPYRSSNICKSSAKTNFHNNLLHNR